MVHGKSMKRIKMYGEVDPQEKSARDFSIGQRGVSGISAKELMAAMEKIDGMPDGKEKKKLMKLFQDSVREPARKILQQAIVDGVVTEKEVKGWMKKYGVKDYELGELIKPMYVSGFTIDDGKVEREGEQRTVNVITMNEKSAVYRLRHLAKRRFRVHVITAKEFISRVERGEIKMPEGWQEAKIAMDKRINEMKDRVEK